MKHSAIVRIPLAFLFVPTLLAAVAIFIYFQLQLHSNFDKQLNAHARHVLYQVAQISRKPLMERRFSPLKQSLWSFAQSSDSGIDNIVIYDSNGEFVTALSLNEQIVESGVQQIPNPQFYEKEGFFHAWGAIGSDASALPNYDLNDSLGVIWLSFSYEPFQFDSNRNILVVCLITIAALLLGALIWRYRHSHFNRQLNLVNEALVSLNKGYKHTKLPGVKGYQELNRLQQQLNGLVGFFEKRLTMKQFEVSALEQTLSQANDKSVTLNTQLSELNERLEKSRHNTPSLAADMFRVCYQSLQTQLAAIEQMINECKASEGQQQKINQSLNRLNQMLSELKVLCDIVGEQRRAHLELVCMDQLIDSVSRLVKPLAHDKGLEFIVCRPDHDIEMELDVNQLQKILITLLQSAVEATHEGYIKLSFEVSELETPDESGNHHLLNCQVLETSSGMLPSRYELLANDKVDDKLEDDAWITSGLHLMVAKKTTESLQGNYQVKSLSGLGVLNTVSFPCRLNHLEAPDLSAYLGCKVLLFDPVVESAEPVIDLLSDSGMQVLYCRDAEQLQQTFDNAEVHCAILSRPCSPSRQAAFDEVILALQNGRYPQKCLFLHDGEKLPIALPSGWGKAEKPFVLSALLNYYQGGVAPDGCMATVAEAAPCSNVMEILAVDDNETNLKLLSVVLRDYPVKLVQALSGKEALKHCRRQTFDVILMDKEMPNMNGVETCLHIRQSSLNQTTPVVMFTAHIDDEEKRQLLDLQVDDCMVKPLDESKFYYLMDTWCAKRWRQINGR